MTIISVGGCNAAEFASNKSFGHKGELRTGYDNRRGRNRTPFSLACFKMAWPAASVLAIGFSLAVNI